jgi:hypothetical protein
MTQSVYLCRIRFWLAIVIVGLVLNGITAFPLQIELGWLVSFLHTSWLQPIAESVHLLPWVERVNEGLTATNAHYPFLAKGNAYWTAVWTYEKSPETLPMRAHWPLVVLKSTTHHQAEANPNPSWKVVWPLPCQGGVNPRDSGPTRAS